MNIGIDLDGTAWEYQDFFKELVVALKQRGHSISIITAHVNLVEADLLLWKRRGFPPVDAYISKVTGEEGIPSREWKLDTAKKYNLDYIFDDFDTKEVRLIKC